MQILISNKNKKIFQRINHITKHKSQNRISITKHKSYKHKNAETYDSRIQYLRTSRFSIRRSNKWWRRAGYFWSYRSWLLVTMVANDDEHSATAAIDFAVSVPFLHKPLMMMKVTFSTVSQLDKRRLLTMNRAANVVKHDFIWGEDELDRKEMFGFSFWRLRLRFVKVKLGRFFFF